MTETTDDTGPSEEAIPLSAVNKMLGELHKQFGMLKAQALQEPSFVGHLGQALDTLYKENEDLKHQVDHLQRELSVRKTVRKTMEDGTEVTTYD